MNLFGTLRIRLCDKEFLTFTFIGINVSAVKQPITICRDFSSADTRKGFQRTLLKFNIHSENCIELAELS